MNWYYIYLAVGLALGLWMYYDAKKRKFENPSVWIFAGLFFGVIGFVAYYFWFINSKKKK